QIVEKGIAAEELSARRLLELLARGIWNERALRTEQIVYVVNGRVERARCRRAGERLRAAKPAEVLQRGKRIREYATCRECVRRTLHEALHERVRCAERAQYRTAGERLRVAKPAEILHRGKRIRESAAC